jgi:hypothetical protein
MSTPSWRIRLRTSIHQLRDRIADLAELRVVTVVGQVDVIGPDPEVDVKVQSGKAIRSRVNLIDGDTITEVDDSLLEERFAPLRDMHRAREEAAGALVEKRIDTVKALLALMRDELSRPDAPEDAALAAAPAPASPQPSSP